MRSSLVAVRTVALGMMLCACGFAVAQEQGRDKLVPPKFDPVSLRGPNAAAQFSEIKFDQKLNNQVPLDLKFKDEHGKDVSLKDYFTDKPVVLSLVYYECPMLCNIILNGMAAAFDAADNKLEIGKDYIVVSVSINPKETPELAAAKKATYLKQYHRKGGEEGWHFLTGSQNAIEDLAMAVGYRYYYDKTIGQYAHASGIMVLTPQGKVSSYYFGIEYLPKRLQFAIMDASKGHIGPLVDQLVLLCYAYDPTRGVYGFYILNAVRLGGCLTVLAILVFWGFQWRSARRAAAAAAQQGP